MTNPSPTGESGSVPEKTCEFVVQWGNKFHSTIFCGTSATKRYPASGGGFMYLCDEHSLKHLDYAEGVPRD